MCDQHPWGLATGLVCTGIGDPHTHVFAASSMPDVHDVTEQKAEASHG